LIIFDVEKINIDSSLENLTGKIRIIVNFEDLKKELSFKKYSPKTIKAYIHFNRDFMQKSKKLPQQVTNEDIKDYLIYLAEEREVSTSTINRIVKALYGTVLKKKFILTF